MVFGINSKAVNCTRLRLVQLFPALLVLLIPNTTANHAITYTYSVAVNIWLLFVFNFLMYLDFAQVDFLPNTELP